MRRFAIVVIALVLAPGLQSAGISNFPQFIAPETRPLPIEPELRPEITVPGLRPEPLPETVPEVEPVIPDLVSINPCDSCFEYMTALIGQLSGIETPVHPELPEVSLPEEIPEIGRPVPEDVPEDLRPLPLPVAPEVEVNPIPIPVAPEVGIRPLPLPIAPEVEVNPIPEVAPPLLVTSEALDEY